jgi:alkylation response protein AidB-like acyl-CoA dehydrogenase
VATTSTPTAAAAAGGPGFAERIAAYVAEVVVPAAAAMARGEGDGGRSHVRALGERGLAGLLVPVQYGGAGLGYGDFVALIRAVARECASAAVALDVHLSVATEPIIRFGSAEQQRRFLPHMASGEWVGAFALSEPGSGSDAASLQCRAERAADGSYRLNGTKMWISNGGIADVYVVMARSGGPGAGGISTFLVEATRAGLSAGQPLRKLGLRGSRTTELNLEDVVVPEENRLGPEGIGFTIAMTVLDSGRIGISAQAVGIAEGALRVATAHVRDAGMEVPDEAALLDDAAAARLPTALATLSDMAARIAAAERLVAGAVALCPAGEGLTRMASVAKLWSTDTAVAAAHSAVELCAPESASEAHPASIRLRDAKACQIYEGTNQIQRVVIARELLRD